MSGKRTPASQECSLEELSSVDACDWEKTTTAILEYCVREFGAESASIFLMEGGGESLHLVNAIGSRRNHHCGKSLALGEGISGFVASTKAPLLVADFSTEKRLIPRKDGYPVDTFMSCPVLKDPLVLAVINVAGRATGRVFSESDLKKLQSISDGCADALNKTIASWRSSQADNGDASPKKRSAPAKQLMEWGDYSENILQCLSEQVMVFDQRFDINYCSKQEEFRMLFGEAKQSRNILDLPLRVDREDLKRNLEIVIREGKPFSLTNVQVTNLPEFRVVNMSFSPFSSAYGGLTGGLMLLDDNTRNYEMQQRLVEAEKFSLIGSLTSMITHEVNNPLDGVMRLINLSLRQIGEDEPVREYLTEAQKGLNRIASLVGSLLNFSRKGIVLDSEFAGLNAVVENVLAIMKSRKQDKEISVELSLAAESPTVRTDDFYQIISNLVSNAFDAAPPQYGEVIVQTQVNGSRLYLTVKDNGPGIPEHLQSRIFSTFYTTKEYGKGTGLGLAIVKKMVEKYGGTIKVESAQGAGTEMRLAVPLDRLEP